jgi:hypothetical protein
MAPAVGSIAQRLTQSLRASLTQSLRASKRLFLLPASRKPITASATKYKYQDHDDNDCLNAHSEVSSCLLDFSHTPFDGLELPSGITKNARKGHCRSLCRLFGEDRPASSTTVGDVFSVPRSGYLGHWRFPDFFTSLRRRTPHFESKKPTRQENCYKRLQNPRYRLK